MGRALRSRTHTSKQTKHTKFIFRNQFSTAITLNPDETLYDRLLISTGQWVGNQSRFAQELTDAIDYIKEHVDVFCSSFIKMYLLSKPSKEWAGHLERYTPEMVQQMMLMSSFPEPEEWEGGMDGREMLRGVSLWFSNITDKVYRADPVKKAADAAKRKARRQSQSKKLQCAKAGKAAKANI